MSVATIDAFHRDPKRFWEFYRPRFHALSDKRPNPAHEALAELERRGLLDAVITQNIDRLHRKAGSERVIEVHGSIATASCTSCEASYRARAGGVAVRRGGSRHLHLLRRQGEAGRRPVRGAAARRRRSSEAQACVRGADLLLCVGSSLEVYPVAGLPGLTLAGGGRIAIVTKSSTPYDSEAAVRLDGDVVEELERAGCLGAGRTGLGRSSALAARLPAVRSRPARAAPRSQDPERLGASSGRLVSGPRASCRRSASLGGRDAWLRGGRRGRPGPRPGPARAVRAARPAAPRGRREAEAPPPGSGPASRSARARRSSGSQSVDRLAAGEHRGQPLLRAKGLGAPLAPRRRRDLERLLPATLGEPVAGSVADPGDQSGLAPDLVAVGVLGGDPVRPQDRVRAFAARRRSRPRPPRRSRATRSSSPTAASRVRRLGRDHRQARQGDLGRWAGLDAARPDADGAAGAPRPPPASARRPRPAVPLVLAAHQVAPVVEPQAARARRAARSEPVAHRPDPTRGTAALVAHVGAARRTTPATATNCL